MTIQEVLQEMVHIQEIWINEQGEYFFSDPKRLGFEKKTRDEILEIKKVKSKIK